MARPLPSLPVAARTGSAPTPTAAASAVPARPFIGGTAGRLLVIKIRQGHPRQPLANLALDAHQESFFCWANQHPGVPLVFAASGSANAVNVILRHVGHIEAD